MNNPVAAATEELANGRPEYALVHALLAMVARLDAIDMTLTAILVRPVD